MDEVKPDKIDDTTKEPYSTSKASGHSDAADKPLEQANATDEERMRPDDISSKREVKDSPPENSATSQVAVSVDEQHQQAQEGQAVQRTESDTDSAVTDNVGIGVAKEATKGPDQLPQERIASEAENDKDVDFKLACSFHDAKATEEGQGNGLEDAACQTVRNEMVDESRRREETARDKDESQKSPEEAKKEFIEVLVEEALGNDQAELPKVEGGNNPDEATACKVHRGMSGRTITIESEHDKRRSERFSLW